MTPVFGNGSQALKHWHDKLIKTIPHVHLAT